MVVRVSRAGRVSKRSLWIVQNQKIRETSLRVLECGGKSARHRFPNAVAGQLRN